VERVFDIGQINGLPTLPSVILGICSDRGRVLTVIDAAALLGATEGAPSALLPRLLVLKVNGGNLALQVDAVEGIRLEEPNASDDPSKGEGDPTSPMTLTLQTLLEKLEMFAA
jgi:chemotaxis signal transduction protein